MGGRARARSLWRRWWHDDDSAAGLALGSVIAVIYDDHVEYGVFVQLGIAKARALIAGP